MNLPSKDLPTCRVARPHAPLVLLMLGLLHAASCGDPDAAATCEEAGPGATCALFDVLGQDPDLFALPYPNDILLQDDGTIDLRHLTEQADGALALFSDIAAENLTGGFGLTSPAYFRFSAAIDEACLPQTPADTLSPNASLQWINIDPTSPEYGQRTPVQVQSKTEVGHFIGGPHVASIPVAGFPLRPATRYAVVLTDALCATAHETVRPADALLALLDEAPPADPALVQAHQRYAPLREYLQQGDLEGTVIDAAVFTTGKPTELLARARQVVLKQPAPELLDPRIYWETPTYYEILATFQSPNFQFGKHPYLNPTDGGNFQLDASGAPRISFQETLRVSFTIPKGDPPAGGWPLVLYAHGTGGDYRSYVRGGMAQLFSAMKNEQGQVQAKFAMVGIDQPLHGARSNGYPKEMAYLNPLNPAGTLGTRLQSAVDDFSLLRLMKGIVRDRVPWARAADKPTPVTFDPPLRFNPQQLYFMGHSQGVITGTLYLAMEPEIKGAVLSAGGGGVTDHLVNVSEELRLLWEAAMQEQVDVVHPVVGLAQQVFDQMEPYVYGQILTHDRPQGVGPKHLLFIEGTVDHHVLNRTTEGLALTAGVPLGGEPVTDAPAMALAGIEPLSLPLQGNIVLPEGAFTGALMQYNSVPVTSGTKTCEEDADCGDGRYCHEGACHYDGHFVSFHNPDTQRHIRQFMSSMLLSGTPTIGP